MKRNSDDLLDQPPVNRNLPELHPPSYILWSAFFGGPLAGGVLFFINFYRTGHTLTGYITLFGGALLSFVYYYTPVFSSFGLYTFLYTLGYLYLTTVINANLNTPIFKKHKSQSGKSAPWYKSTGIVILVVGVNILLLKPHEVLYLFELLWP